MPLDGKSPANWVRTADVALKPRTYWGRETDIGTPGYANADTLPLGRMSFSELMLTSRGGLHSLPQWIELYNASETETVNLKGWQLKIEGRNERGEHWSEAVTLDNQLIPPEQTVIIVTWTGRRSREIPQDCIYYLFQHAEFAQKGRRALQQHGLFLKLVDPNGGVTDVVGNLDGDRLTADAPIWELPAGMTPEGFRTSLLRRYNTTTRYAS